MVCKLNLDTTSEVWDQVKMIKIEKKFKNLNDTINYLIKKGLGDKK